MRMTRTYPRTGQYQRECTWQPLADIVENEDAFTVTLDVPGYTAENVKVRFEDHILRVSGERPRKEAGDEKYYRYHERPVAFERSFRIPDTLKGDEIKAGLEHGVLTLVVPKREETKPRTIEIS